MLLMRRDKPSRCVSGEGVNPVCILKEAFEGWTGDAQGCSTMVLPWCHLKTETGRVRGRDKRARITMKKKKKVQVERGLHSDWQSAVVSDGELAQETKIKSG